MSHRAAPLALLQRAGCRRLKYPLCSSESGGRNRTALLLYGNLAAWRRLHTPSALMPRTGPLATTTEAPARVKSLFHTCKRRRDLTTAGAAPTRAAPGGGPPPSPGASAAALAAAAVASAAASGLRRLGDSGWVPGQRGTDRHWPRSRPARSPLHVIAHVPPPLLPGIQSSGVPYIGSAFSIYTAR
jgi:hypothetical protein